MTIERTMRNPAHPGELLQHWLSERGLDVEMAASGLDVSSAELSSIIDGHTSISKKFDLHLSEALGTPQGYWLRVKKLLDICDSLKLSSESIYKVHETVIELSHFEKNKASLKTDAQLINELDVLKLKIEQTAIALKNISNQNYHYIKWSLGEFSFPGELLDLKSSMEQWDIAILGILESTMQGAEEAKVAVKVRAALRSAPHGIDERQRIVEVALNAESMKKGRLTVLPMYATFISNLASFVCVRDGIPPVRKGNFEKLCEIIFEVAGVHSKPEGAIRFFLKIKR